MKKVDMKKLIDDNGLEFEIRAQELLKLKNEIKQKKENERKLEDWLQILRGKHESLMNIFNQTPEDFVFVNDLKNEEVKVDVETPLKGE